MCFYFISPTVFREPVVCCKLHVTRNVASSKHLPLLILDCWHQLHVVGHEPLKGHSAFQTFFLHTPHRLLSSEEVLLFLHSVSQRRTAVCALMLLIYMPFYCIEMLTLWILEK